MSGEGYKIEKEVFVVDEEHLKEISFDQIEVGDLILRINQTNDEQLMHVISEVSSEALTGRWFAKKDLNGSSLIYKESTVKAVFKKVTSSAVIEAFKNYHM